MAGAGYKLFATGDVLTAAQVNTYLMQQTVMVFASSAARTSALSGVLAEGMVSYLQDTNTLEVYDGAAWVGATGDITGLTAGTGISISSATGPVPTVTNAMATEITAKGDLIVGTGSATFDNLAAGSNGETLVADSSTSTGLRYTALFGANKNKILNGDFYINQRSFTSSTSTATYTFDRWRTTASQGGVTFTAETFTPGTAPVSGYEGKNYLRIVTTGQTSTATFSDIRQKIESVRTLAGQTATISFWAKAASGTPKVAVEFNQFFGSGGTPSANVLTYAGQATLSTSWARYSLTVTIPSIAGKTLGTTEDGDLGVELVVSAGSDFNARTGSLGIQSNTFEFWGVQVEAGSVATPFQTATGTLQGELAACQRYYFRTSSTGRYATGYAKTTTAVDAVIPFPVTMRIAPTALEQSGTAADYLIAYLNSASACSSVPTFTNGSPYASNVTFTTGAVLTAGNGVNVGSNGASAYLGWSAEL